MPTPERRSIAFYLAILVLALALAALYLQRGKEESGPSLPPLPDWEPSSEDISQQEALDSSRQNGFELRAGDKALLKALAVFHRVEIETLANSQMTAYRDATVTYRITAERYVRDYGRERYAQLGLEVRHRFQGALEILTHEAKAKGRTLAGQVAHAPNREELLHIREFGGGFLDFAVQQGLISEHGQMDDSYRFLIGVLFKVRWHKWVQKIDPINANLTRRERRAWLRYQVKVPPVMTLSRRIRKLKDLASIDPGYPYAMAYAVILIRSGRIEEARMVVHQALTQVPADLQLRRIQDFLDRLIVQDSGRGVR
jgi:hypothetical protein